MKLKSCTLALILLGMTALTAHAATSLSMLSRWPYTPVASFLLPSPNAVTSGPHKSFPTKGLIIWTTGDTVSIVKNDDLTLVHAFRVATSNVIQDVHYRADNGTETLYIAAGKSGLIIYDISKPNAPIPKGEIHLAPDDNPGSLRISETETKEITEIDARGLGYHDNHIFLADSNFGMRVINVTDPDKPMEVPLATQNEERISGYKQPNISGSYTTTGGYTNAFVCPFDNRVYALILDYYFGLRVFDVTNPAVIDAPSSKDMRTNMLYGSIALVTGLFGAEAPDGNLYAYVTAMDTYAQESVVAKLRVLAHGEALRPNSIINTGNCLTPGDATGVTVSENTGYVADGDKGLQIISFSPDPVEGKVHEYPIIGSFETNTKGSYSVDFLNDEIHMAVAENGLQKIDVSTPSAPGHLQTLNSPICGDAIIYHGDHTYLLDGDSGMFIFDATSPAYLSLLGVYLTSGTAYDLAVSGETACIANGSAGLTIVDVADKAAPVLLSTIDTPDAAMATALFQTGAATHACIANGATHPYLMVDLSDPNAPGPLVDIDATGFTPGNALDVAVQGNVALFADEHGLKIADLSNPAAPAIIAEKETPGRAVAVAAFEQGGLTYALVADTVQGITIENITDPRAIPGTIATIPHPDEGQFKHIDVQGHIAFAASGTGGVTAFDLSTPETPIALASSGTKSSAEQVSAFMKDGSIHSAVAEKYNGMVLLKLNETTPQEPAAPMESSSSSSCFINTITH